VKPKPVPLEELQQQMIMLANALEYTPQVHALRLAINALLDAYERETTRAFGLGMAAGAVLAGVLLLGGSGAGF